MAVKIGDTVRFTVEFKDFSSVYADPTNIILKIYDKHRRQVGSNISITESHKISTGNYSYDYTVPSNVDEYIIYEISGTLEGTTILDRKKLEVEFIST